MDIPPEFEAVTGKLRWKCIRCGWCCMQEWNIDLTWDEYDRLKDYLPLDKALYDEETGASHPFLELKGGCPRYDSAKRECTIHDILPYSCAAFPFLLVPPSSLYVNRFCLGLGKGSRLDSGAKRRELIALKRNAGIDVTAYEK